MKIIIRLAFLALTVLLIYSCKKEKVTLPVVETATITQISYDRATGGGIVTSSGGGALTAAGICWSITANPTVSNSKSLDATVPGPFTSNITMLVQNTKYYVRAYAINSAGTGYGNEVSFSTIQGDIPLVTTTIVSNITLNGAASGGTITSARGAAVSAKGVCWGLIPNPTIYNNKSSDGSGSGNFTSTVSGLAESTRYYIRAYATNSNGTGYGNELSFITNAPARKK